MSANERQVGGEHYQTAIQPWDYISANGLDYFQGNIVKYVSRWQQKGGVEDLKKARHYLDKYIELNEKNPTPVSFSVSAGKHPPHPFQEPVDVLLQTEEEAHPDWVAAYQEHQGTRAEFVVSSPSRSEPPE